MPQLSRATRATTDHDEIREWVESHGGQPSVVRRTRGERGRGNVGLLRIEFQNAPRSRGRQSLEPISWNEFFDQFDESGLAFLYEPRSGKELFNKLVSRETVRARLRGERKAKSPHKKATRSVSARRARTSARTTRPSRAAKPRRAKAARSLRSGSVRKRSSQRSSQRSGTRTSRTR